MEKNLYKDFHDTIAEIEAHQMRIENLRKKLTQINKEIAEEEKQKPQG